MKTLVFLSIIPVMLYTLNLAINWSDKSLQKCIDAEGEKWKRVNRDDQ